MNKFSESVRSLASSRIVASSLLKFVTMGAPNSAMNNPLKWRRLLALPILDFGYVLETGQLVLQDNSDALRQNPQVKNALARVRAKRPASLATSFIWLLVAPSAAAAQ